jgi:hypothetical protein
VTSGSSAADATSSIIRTSSSYVVGDRVGMGYVTSASSLVCDLSLTAYLVPGSIPAMTFSSVGISVTTGASVSA